MRIDVADLYVGADLVAIVVKFVHAVFRFGFIQPKQADTVVVIILLALFPYEIPGFGVGSIQEQAVAAKLHRDFDPIFRLNEQPFFLHFLEVFTAQIDLRPDGHHERDAQFFQFLAHGFGIREEFFVKAEVAHTRPVEKVDDNHIQRQSPAFVFPGDLQDLFLIPVAQFALPETKAIFGHHGHGAGGFGIGFFNFCRGVAGRYPVIQLFRALGHPFGTVTAEGGAADRRVVPQETVPAAGKYERHAGLGIAVGQLERAVFNIHHSLLILAHAVQFFIRIAKEGSGQLIVAAQNGFKPPGVQIESAVPS